MVDIEKINELVGNKEFKEADALISEALVEDSQNIELLKLGGLVSTNLEKWGIAEQLFEKVTKLNSDDATSWFYLAKCYERLGSLDLAKSAYIEVLRLRPQYDEACISLCKLCLKLANYDSTIEYAKKILQEENHSNVYYFIIGVAYMKKKEYGEALGYLQKAYEIEPQNLVILNTLGTCYTALNKIDEAIKTYFIALELDKENSTTYYNIGSSYQVQNKHKEAIEYLLKAYELEPDEVYLSALALSESKAEYYDKALEHYKQLSLMVPNKESYKYNIAICYEALGDSNQAISILEKFVFINTKFVLAAQKLANLYVKMQQYNKAKTVYDEILLKGKVTAEILHQYAIISSSLCDTDVAEKILKKAIKMKPEYSQAHKDLGIIYLNKRLFDYADIELKTAIDLAPNDYENIFEYGNFLYSMSRNSEAEEYYKKALELEPDNAIALTFMALNYLVLNKLDLAKEYIHKAIHIEPNHEYVQFCTGRILYACKEYEQAKRYLVSAVEQNPDIETQNTLALTYFALNDYQQALNIFKNIIEKSPKSVSVLMDIAKCYEALEDNDNALSYLDKVVDIFPEDEEAHEMIRKLS